MATRPKRPRDTDQLAKLIVDLSTGEGENDSANDAKDPAAVSLGKRGGLKGGPARANSLSAEKRKEIAKKPRRQDGVKLAEFF